MRQRILRSLIRLNKPINEIRENLSALTWDSDESTVLTRNDIVEILKRFLGEEIDMNTLSEWANTIEGRDDIDYEDEFYESIKQAVYEMANPDLEGAFCNERASLWISKLQRP